MGLIADAQSDIIEAFDGDLSDIVCDFQLTRNTKGEFDAIEAEYTTISNYYSSRGIFDAYETREIQDEVKIGDIKLICVASEIYIEPIIDDIIELDETELKVINVKNVFDITYEVQCRGV